MAQRGEDPREAESDRPCRWLFEVEGYSHEEIARSSSRSVSFSKSQARACGYTGGGGKVEDRIAAVDALLTSVGLDGPRSDNPVALQQERVRLIGSLAQMRYAESLDVGLS